jgi:hypothetical protein
MSASVGGRGTSGATRTGIERGAAAKVARACAEPVRQSGAAVAAKPKHAPVVLGEAPHFAEQLRDVFRLGHVGRTPVLNLVVVVNALVRRKALICEARTPGFEFDIVQRSRRLS